jgi:LmbE family N-acetylglucosaminyl deacetylase
VTLQGLGRGDPAEPAVLVVAAHPDDETIGLGALLARLRDATVLHVTDGAPRDGRDTAQHGFATREAYAAARRVEALAALAIAGIGADRAPVLGIADQEASLHLVPATHRIAELVEARRPGLVVTHAYEGGHPDHDAVAFAVRAALRLLPDPPPLAEMTGYHAGPDGIVAGRFLPPEGDVVAFQLDVAGEATKRAMLDCFVTQRAVLAAFPTCAELLRAAPPADFTRPPHAGTLFYERFPWGMDFTRFRAVARAALDGLGLA